MVAIYKTSNLEEAVRKMHKNSAHSIVYQKYSCPRKIPLRLDEIKGLPLLYTSMKPAQQLLSLKVIDKWLAEGGLLRFLPTSEHVETPECDSLIFVECPLSHKYFLRAISNVQRDVIVYRPPSWEMHEEAMNYQFPTKNYFETLKVGIEVANTFGNYLKEFVNKDNNFLAFHIKEVEKLVTMPIRRMESMLSKLGKWDKVVVYEKKIRPLDHHKKLQAAYDHFTTDVFCQSSRKPEVPLGDLVKYRYLRARLPVYLIKFYENVDYEIETVRAALHRSDWYRLRNLIDQAPDY